MAKRKRITPPAAGPRALDEDLVDKMTELVALVGFLGDLEALVVDPDEERYIRQAVIDRLLVVAESGLSRAKAAPQALKAPKAVA